MFRHTPIFQQLNQDYQDILDYLIKIGYTIDPITIDHKSQFDFGEAYSIAYPIQGLLKYHGMVDPSERIAMFPSISLNNGAFFTITYLKFDQKFPRDRFYLNGLEQDKNEDYQRVKFQLDKIRNFAGIQTRAIIISRNVIQSTKTILLAKGLGTSAAGGAAIARAAFSILYEQTDALINSRLLSVFSRYLSGSAARSSVGGIALWLSAPDRNSWKSFALRLDTPKDQEFITGLSLITVPIQSSITTTVAHKLAPSSPFYRKWCLSRKDKIYQFLGALQNRDLSTIGRLAEEDTKMLHKIHTTSTMSQSYWTEDTINLMKFADEIKKNGVPIYYSIDTGPSVVFLVPKHHENQVYETICLKFPKTHIYKGSIAGSSTVINPTSNLIQLLDDDIAKFSN